MNLIQSQKMTFIGAGERPGASDDNPLVGMMNITDVLMDLDPKDRNYELLKMIRRRRCCQQTISRLLAFSRKPRRTGSW